MPTSLAGRAAHAVTGRATLLTVDVEPDWGAVAAPSASGPAARSLAPGGVALAEVAAGGIASAGVAAPCEGIRLALPRLLHELERRGVRATFFVVGELAELFARHVDPRAGHEVGAHGLSHRRLSRLPAVELQREVTEARARLAAAGFAVDGFRAPFLDAPAGLAALLARAGYRYDASGGALGPSLRNRSRAPRAALGSGDVARVRSASLLAPGVPCNLTWLRLLDPLGLALLPRRPAQLSLHLHELLPASRGMAGLPGPLARLHARGCGPRAWELLLAALDRTLDDGGRFVTCRELLIAPSRAAGAA